MVRWAWWIFYDFQRKQAKGFVRVALSEQNCWSLELSRKAQFGEKGIRRLMTNDQEYLLCGHMEPLCQSPVVIRLRE